jgi:hypothetical protein
MRVVTSGRTLLDPAFAQTVSVDEPYHVFVQPYGRAELHVSARTTPGRRAAAPTGALRPPVYSRGPKVASSTSKVRES